MKEKQSEEWRARVRFVGYYQLLGGLLGAGLVGWLLAQQRQLSALLIVLALALGLYLYSVYCGRLLLRPDPKPGLRPSAINQALQVIHFAVAGYSYKFMAGVAILPGIEWTDKFNMTFHLSVSSFEFTINRSNEVIQLQINAVAVFLIACLSRLQRMADEQTAREAADEYRSDHAS